MNRIFSCLFIGLFWSLAACVPGLGGDVAPGVTAVISTHVASEVVVKATPTKTPTSEPSPTNRPTEAITKTATARVSAATAATDTQTPAPISSITPTPSITPWPTPSNLPAAPRGWLWRLHATGIPVTHYIIYELSPDSAGESRERPYGLGDEPLANIDPLPRTFLLRTAYQGSGRLPNGEILQYAAVRAPVEQGLVPFRYVVTPAERCDGHPVAGNGTCSVPLKTAATTWRDGEEPLVPVGSTIFIPELNMKIRINDVALSDGPPKIDLYTGVVNNYDYERPNGATIWILTGE